MHLLAGDIGGTKTHLALFEQKGKQVQIKAQHKFPSHDYDSLEAVCTAFLEQEKLTVDKACFGVAGAVNQGVCHATNLPWEIETKKLAKACGVLEKNVAIINDLESNAWGIEALEEKDLCVINKGVGVKGGHRALISAGTGLGEAGLICMDGDYYPFSSEGGHVDFAPKNEEEDKLLNYLRGKWDHVSYERVLSGPGLANVHEFLLKGEELKERDDVLEEMEKEDKAFVISRWAIEKKSPVCERALLLFCSIYAAAAGNLALKILATNGLFIGGGIAPKILDFLKSGDFFNDFKAKGRFEPLLEKVPIYVILREDTALLGSMVFARDRLG